MYLAIIEYLQKMRKHDLENDLKLLKDESLSWGMRMAIVYRSEKTKILKSQVLICKMAQYAVKYSTQAIKDGIFKDIVLRQTDLEYEQEKQLTDDKAKLENAKKFQYRRLINSSYFKYVYTKSLQNTSQEQQ